MAVETIDPGLPVQVSEAARQHFSQQIEQAQGSAIYLRLKESGCTGYMYELDLVQDVPAGALAVTLSEDLRLYVDRQSLPMLQGTRIDYVREGLNSELRFQNPNAGEYCGCGESFSIGADVS